jgi:hypothetical protein
MSEKQVNTESSPEIIDAAPDLHSYPVVAEGTGKTAANEGAQSKTVYNVRIYPCPLHGFCMTNLVDCRLSYTLLSKRPTSTHGPRSLSIFTVSP